MNPSMNDILIKMLCPFYIALDTNLNVLRKFYFKNIIINQQWRGENSR